jgi:hypothetical protein
MGSKSFMVIFLVLVQTGTAQTLTGHDSWGTDTANNPSILLEAPTKVLSESLFVGKGIKGVYLELSIPIPPANAIIAEVQYPEKKSDSLQKIGHFYGSQGGIKPFIATFRSGPFNCLLNAVGGKNTINDRLPGLKSNICNPFGDF